MIVQSVALVSTWEDLENFNNETPVCRLCFLKQSFEVKIILKNYLIKAIDNKISCLKKKFDLLIPKTAQNVNKVSEQVTKQISELKQANCSKNLSENATRVMCISNVPYKESAYGANSHFMSAHGCDVRPLLDSEEYTAVKSQFFCLGRRRILKFQMHSSI